MLEIKDLKKRYGRFQALDGLSMEVGDGELYGFVGPNGAGKTTTIKIITGLLSADSGSVTIDGVDAEILVSGFMREKGSLETLFMQLTTSEEERMVIISEEQPGL